MPQLNPITVFSFSGTGSVLFAGPLIRQITEDIARALSAFPNTPSRAHHLLHETATPLDPHLQTENETLSQDDGPPEIHFILMRSFLSQSLVRTLSQSLGVHLAITGRIFWNQENMEMALNLWDTRSNHLLYCTVREGAREALLERLTEAIAEMAFRIEAKGAESLSESLRKVRASFGTLDLAAFEAYANAADKLRSLELGQKRIRHTDITRALCRALELDPGYEAARIMLLEHSTERLQQHDLPWAEEIGDLVRSFEDFGLSESLISLEISILQRKKKEAQATLDLVQQTHPHFPHLETLQHRVSACA